MENMEMMMIFLFNVKIGKCKEFC